MASFDIAKLLNKITQDIPGINTVLKALAKWDVSALTDVPDGAMQATTDASNRLTIKKKISGSYTSVAKLLHDVDTVDGYHASASATANTVAVRNADGALPGNVLGKAATADTATALAAGSVVPVNQGGTGATTASGARSNLGIAGSADFTAHVATAASPTVTGHVALDALAADGTATAAPGGYGWGTETPVAADLNTLGNSCLVWCNPNITANKPPTTNYHACVFHIRIDSVTALQYHYANGGLNTLSRRQTAGIWTDWLPLPKGITDSVSTLASDISASATAVKTVNDSAVHNTGDETIEGKKTFTSNPIIQQANLYFVRTSAILGTAPNTLQSWIISNRDANSSWVSQIEGNQYTDNSIRTRLVVRNINQTTGSSFSAALALVAMPDGTTYADCPTPPANATSNQIATAAWVLSHSNAEQVGDIIASFAATRAGCLLMNGAVVSRTTYANLFALIGTAFGAGDGTTTFNLPNARDRVLQGANGNLMQYLAAGLPNITGSLNIGALGGASSGALFGVTTGATQRSTTDTYSNSSSVNIDASRSSSKYGASTTVQSAAITVNFFIKY